MNTCVKDKLCPLTGQAQCLVKDLVNDHPWLWTIAAGIVGILMGRHCCCKKRKKC
ncbi:hypothetical protein [Aristophania vespae]|uniref:hypothetical protein n=1 Tax=Aristophania vespae TaxID=2697033 RepID=UPI0023516F09|nr:hypothetical protein [Aristophania vespae]UMM63610.1 hypothetical protein DM15PD_05840 [Aristophania vespae]